MKMNPIRYLIPTGFIVFFAGWTAINWQYLVNTQNGIIRFFLPLFMSVLIMLRPNVVSHEDTAPAFSFTKAAVNAIAGTLLVIFGTVLGSKQFEWIGILLLAAACLGSALNNSKKNDLILSLCLLFFAHPFPTSLFLKLQMTMQQLSVSWSEWLLHIFNVHAFATGFVINHGANVFDIPELCSGMRVVTTVFLMTAGLSIIKRLRFIETFLFVVLSILQALILNVFRISIMVAFLPSGASEATYKVLHDISGIVTIAAILLIYAEISAYLNWKHRNTTRMADEIPSDKPPFFQMLQRKRWLIIFGFVFVILTAGLFYKSKPQHRTDMIVPVAETLRDKKLEETLQAAELAIYSSDPDLCATNVILAMRQGANISRVRALYPYLASHRKFESIVQSNSNEEFVDIAQLLAATEAYMNLNMLGDIGRLSREAVNKWPDDPRVIEPLFYIAMHRTDSNWGELFAQQLTRSTRHMTDIPSIYSNFWKCFMLGRPDLVWHLFNRIKAIDSTNPLLWMSVAKHGEGWFVFKKQNIGLSAESFDDVIDIKPYFLLGSKLEAWQPLCNMIPLGSELCVRDVGPVRKKYLAMAIDEFEKRRKSHPIGGVMLHEYISALEIGGMQERVTAELKAASTNTSTACEADPAMIASEIHEESSQWEQVYETLKDYYTPETAGKTKPDLTPMIRLSQAQANMNLGIAAIYTAFETYRLFPDSSQAAGNLAALLVKYESAEQALFYIGKPRTRKQRDMDIIEAESLYMTQRYSELSAFCKSALLPQIPIPANAPQKATVIPAETAVLWRCISLPSIEQYKVQADSARSCLSHSKSPFIRSMLKLWLECYDSNCAGTSADITKWDAIGRNNVEKATALNQLTLLLCLNKKIYEARDAAGRAVKLLPKCPLLWRILISLSDGNSDVLAAARKSCPEDPELWLAELVLKTQREMKNGKKWDENDIIKRFTTEGSRPDDFNPEASARAADYLYRGKMPIPASIAARSACERARSWLPGCLIGIKCSAIDQDRSLAISATIDAINAARNPIKEMYINLVTAKSSDNIVDTDNDMINALKNLRQLDPDNAIWAGVLGLIRFKRSGGDMLDAYYQMSAAIDAGTTNISPFVIAAEASRLLGNHERAMSILRQGLEKHPGNLTMINNLAYSTANSKAAPDEARKYIPKLAVNESNIRMLDTVAYVYLKSNDIDSARTLFYKILKLTSAGTKPWFRAKMFLADIALLEGNNTAAKALLDEILPHSRKIPDEDVLYANALMLKLSGKKESKVP